MLVRYFKPVPTGAELLVEGQIISQEEKAVALRSTIHSANKVLLAEGESTFLFPSLSSIANITGADESMLKAFLTKYSQPLCST